MTDSSRPVPRSELASRRPPEDDNTWRDERLDRRAQAAGADWDEVARIVEAFSNAWSEGGYPPTIAEYVLEANGSTRAIVAAELIKLDLEQRWRQGLRRLVEDYLPDVPDLGEIPASVILEEFHVRRLAGDVVQAGEYFQRFPGRAAELRHLFGMDPALHSTHAAGSGRRPRVDLRPGETIGDFELLIRLGEGAFGAVFLARQTSMQRLVALKVSADAGTEPQTLAQLDHDHIIRVYDQQQLPERRLRLLYMQYAAGGTLDDVIQRLGDVAPRSRTGRHYLDGVAAILDARGESRPAESPVSRELAGLAWPQVVAWIGSRLARALAYAHGKGVLHRDLKPANVLLMADGTPKLADFNVSFSSQLPDASAESQFGGSLAYMAPEHLEALNPQHPRSPADLDVRCDLYSLGMLLSELLTGGRPFRGSPPGRDLPARWIERLTIERRTSRPAGLDDGALDAAAPGLAETLRRCLAPEPADRFASAIDLATELELSLNPAARRLFRGTRGGWEGIVPRHPVLAMTAVTVFPNAVAAVCNFLHNAHVIATQWPAAEPTFMRVQSVINLIAFPVGAFLAVVFAREISRCLQANYAESLSAEELAGVRRRCLNLGHVAAAIGLSLWLLAAPAYPVSLWLILGELPGAVVIHFLASLTLCGLIASAYPFLAVSALAVRNFYPVLLRWNVPHGADIEGLERLHRHSWFYLALAALVPMLSTAVLAVVGDGQRRSLILTAVAGGLGFAFALLLFRRLQNDLNTLTEFLRRSDR
ncbi:serine/threonine-protein kinase [Planctomyces sp. SH-PL14]|uniref:serine/threonine-protein kinase n=1 Tax=Planctomyces sp. SH-PL14 TaxID=1632864 RepID=UPI00078CC52B|nr:serine/threonine-protein kinase [Planctomyces sp. SH-PL14]AMV21314.1 Serine/threonine-protein kinase PknB [Planctomyces sp. SH-PL14]